MANHSSTEQLNQFNLYHAARHLSFIICDGIAAVITFPYRTYKKRLHALLNRQWMAGYKMGYIDAASQLSYKYFCNGVEQGFNLGVEYMNQPPDDGLPNTDRWNNI